MDNIYFHLAGGASGDMLLSSLIDLGCPFSYLKKEFRKLNFDFSVNTKRIPGGHFPRQKIFFTGQTFSNYKELVKVVKDSELAQDIKHNVLKIYEFIALTERKIHRTRGDVKFHHLGETDAILEICGFFLALKYFAVKKVYISSIPLNFPAPVTVEILKGKCVRAVEFPYETVTPTAAALLRDSLYFGDNFSFRKSGIGWGNYGENDCLIAYLFQEDVYENDQIMKIEVNIDDMNPQLFEQVFDSLYKNGAKEVYIQQVIMKKTRPAVVLNVLCLPDDLAKMRDVIFSGTSTFGIRYQKYLRNKLRYKFIYKDTKIGRIKFRVSLDNPRKEIPEYQDCVEAAKRLKIPVFEVYRRLTLF